MIAPLVSVFTRYGPWLAAAYCIFFSLSFLTDPLVLAPQLDAAEIRELAALIRGGILPPEPFYRAPGYPFLLSIIGDRHLPLAAVVLGLAAHLLNGLLAWRLARDIWESTTAAAITCVLVLLNPASLFFAQLMLDITVATTCFLAALYFLLKPGYQVHWLLLAGGLAGAAILIRPHFLPVCLLLPVARLLVDRRLSGRVMIPWIPICGMLLLLGMINLRISGDFRILPWQGTYNLWAANKPGANGLYFKQAVDVSDRSQGTNPAREESVRLYADAHPGEQPPYSIDAMKAHWRRQFIDHAIGNPATLAGLVLWKSGAVFNYFEQYNNYTFSFHRARLPLLRFNPLNYGIILVLGCAGLVLMAHRDRRRFIAWLLLISSFAFTLLLYYASARFRLPLVPLLAIPAGGVALLVPLLREADHPGRRLRWQILPALAVATALAFAPIPKLQSTRTYSEDHMLLAKARADMGDDWKAMESAVAVLDHAPGRREAVEIYASSYFNSVLNGGDPGPVFGSWIDQRGRFDPAMLDKPELLALKGVYLWQWGKREEARGLWHQHHEAFPGELGSYGLSVTGNCPSGIQLDPDLKESLNRVLR